jgi:hypothetical protein
MTPRKQEVNTLFYRVISVSSDTALFGPFNYATYAGGKPVEELENQATIKQASPTTA